MTASHYVDLFRELLEENLALWADTAKTKLDLALAEIEQVASAVDYGLNWPKTYQQARDLILQINPYVNRKGLVEIWIAVLHGAIERCAQNKDPLEIEMRIQLGHLLFLRSQWDEAQQCLEVALQTVSDYSVSAHRDRVLVHLALVYRVSGQYDKALTCCEVLLTSDETDKIVQAEAFNVKGLIAYDRYELTEALTCYEASFSLYEILNDQLKQAYLLINQGNVWQFLKIWENAKEKYEAAIQKFRLAGDEVETYKGIMNLGNIFLLEQEYPKAIQYYEQALPVFEYHDYLLDLGYAYNNIGMAYTGMKNWQRAEAFLTIAIGYWRNLNRPYNLANTLDNLGEMYLLSNQLQKADTTLHEAQVAIALTADSPAKIRLQRMINDHLQQLSTFPSSA